MKSLISLGSLIDETIDIYKDHFKRFMKPALVALVIPAIYALYELIRILSKNSLDATALDLIAIPVNIALALLSFIVIAWITAEMITISHVIATKKPINEKVFALNSIGDFGSYIAVTIIFSLLALLPTIGLISPGIGLIIYAFPKEDGATLSVIGTLLVLLGGFVSLVLLVILAVRLAFIAYEVLIEKTPVIQSFKKSWNLVRGRFFHTFLLLAVPKILISIAQIILTALTSAGLILLIMTLDSTLIAFLGGQLGNIINIAITVIFLPLFVIADYLIFQSLKETATIE